MKQVIAILLFALFILQAIPVVRLFAAAKDVAVASVLDEDKPDDGKQKEKQLAKEFLPVSAASFSSNLSSISYHTPLVHSLPAPYLESFTPPPDVAC